MASAGEREIPCLTGLRGVAALLVFLYHLPWMAGMRDASRSDWPLFDALDIGVGLFFVLSGYLLSLPFWRQIVVAGAQPVNIEAYFVRRCLRILPCYFVALAFFQATNNRTWTFQGVSVLFLYLTGTDSFSHRAHEFRLLPVLWTVGIEMLFYVILVMWFVPFFRAGPAGPRKGALAFGFIAVTALLAGPAYHYAASLLAPRLPEFWLGGGLVESRAIGETVFHFLKWFAPGVLLGLASAGDNRLSAGRWVPELAFLLSVLLLVVIVAHAGEAEWRHVSTWGWPLNAVALVAIVATAPRSRIARLLLDNRLVVFFGNISYGLYLWHVPISMAVIKGSIASHATGETLLVVGGLAGLAVSAAVAWLTHVLIELPAINLGRQYPSWKLMFSALCRGGPR